MVHTARGINFSIQMLNPDEFERVFSCAVLKITLVQSTETIRYSFILRSLRFIESFSNVPSRKTNETFESQNLRCLLPRVPRLFHAALQPCWLFGHINNSSKITWNFEARSFYTRSPGVIRRYIFTVSISAS